MQRGSCQNAQMPGQMMIVDGPSEIEDQAAGVGNAAGEDEVETGGRDVRRQWAQGDEHQPAHEHVEGDGEALWLESAPELEQDAEDCERPNEGEEQPAPGAPEDAEGEWGVGAGDHEEDRRVIQHLEPILRLPRSKPVQCGRAEVEQHGGHGKDAHAHERASTSVVHGLGDQQWGAGHRGEKSAPMAEAIGEFFPAGPFALEPRGCVGGWK